MSITDIVSNIRPERTL